MDVDRDFAYSTGKARALEARVLAAERMTSGQAKKEYGIDEQEPDRAVDELMNKALGEFSAFAPSAVAPFRLMADMENLKAFIRNEKTGEGIPYSPIGSFEMPKSKEGLIAKLKEGGHMALAEKMNLLLAMDIWDSDQTIEKHFLGQIESSLFLEYLKLKEEYLRNEGSAENFYAKASLLIRGKVMLKNMDADVALAYLLLKQRELEIARGKVVLGAGK
jgi:hypothetical protein